MPRSNYAKNETRTDYSTDYNFVKIDREIIFKTDDSGKNRRSEIGLSLPALGLYTILKSYCIGKDKDFCYPSIETLCDITGSTKPTVIKYLKELSSKGLISIQKTVTGRGGYPINIYRMNPIEKAPRRTAKQGATIAGHIQPAPRPVYEGATIAPPLQIAKHNEPESTVKSFHGHSKNISESMVKSFYPNNTNNNKNNLNNDLNDYFKILSQFKDPVNPDSIPFLKRACQTLHNDGNRLIYSAGQLIVKGNQFLQIARPDIIKFLILNNQPETLLKIENGGQE